MNARRSLLLASLAMLACTMSSSASASFEGAQSKDAAGPGERAVARAPSGASQSKTRHDLDSQRAPQAGGNASRASAPNASGPNASTGVADAPTSAAAASQPLVPHYAGTLAEGLSEMEHLADAEKYDDALRIGDELLAPTSFLRWKARVTAEGGWRETLASAADPLLDGLGWNGAEPPQRAAVHYAQGIVQSRAGRRAAAEKAFESARSLSGPGDLRLDAIYDLGTLYLLEGEARRAEIPEISGQPAAAGAPAPGALPIVPPGVPSGVPGGVPGAGGAGQKPPDPLDLAKSAYLRAREHYVERLRSDWRDADARANTELVMRRLKELEEIRKKREQQKKEQEQQNQNDKNQQKKDQDKKDSKDKQDPKDDSQNKDKSQDKKDGDKDQPKPDEQKPEDKKPDEKKPDAKDERRSPRTRRTKARGPAGSTRRAEGDAPHERGSDAPARPIEGHRGESARDADAAPPLAPRESEEGLVIEMLIRWTAIALACVLALASPLRAQGSTQTRVSARLSTGVVKLGSDVRLIVEVEGAREATVGAPPQVDGLKLSAFGGPSVEESYNLSFGRQTVSRKLTWIALIKPQQKGEYTIPSITVRADGKDLATREVLLKVVEDLQGEELGFFEMDAPTQVAEGQPFTLELRFGWDVALDQNLNYANLSLPWIGEMPGMLELDAPPSSPGAGYVDLQLNSRDRIRAEQIDSKTVNGRTFRMLRVRKRYIATRSGKLEFATSHFEFGRVSEGGIFSTRVSKEQTYYKRFPAFDIEVVKLPEKDRPIDFSGAVGRISAHSSADRRDVDAGESIKLSVEWTGDANLEFFDPPDIARIDAFKNFRVYGTTDRKAYDRRTVIYDLAPISPDVHSIPPVPLRTYDPAKKEYVSVATDPIDIHVRPLKQGGGLASEVGPAATQLDIRDIRARTLLASDPYRPGTRTLLGALIAVPLAWFAARTLVRRRGDPDAPYQRARRRARRELARELTAARTASEQARALRRFLAKRSGENEEAWLGRDVIAWTATDHPGASIGADDARSLSELIERLDERTYAGGDESVDAPAVLELADRLAKGGL